MIDSERTTSLEERADDLNIPVEVSSQSFGRPVQSSTGVRYDRSSSRTVRGSGISSHRIEASASAADAAGTKSKHSSAAASVDAFTPAGNQARAATNRAALTLAAGGNNSRAAESAAGTALDTQANAFGPSIHRGTVAK